MWQLATRERLACKKNVYVAAEFNYPQLFVKDNALPPSYCRVFFLKKEKSRVFGYKVELATCQLFKKAA